MRVKRWWLFGWPMPHFDRLIGGGAGGFKEPGWENTEAPSPPAKSQTVSYTFDDIMAAAEHIAQMPEDELREICRILNLDISGNKTELANRVIAHSDLEAIAAAAHQVKAGK